MTKKLEKITKADFEHTYHPEHFYCRLIDIGIGKRKAKVFSSRYEIEIYRPVIKELKK